LTRPGLDEVLAYRAHVDAAMMDVCADEDLQSIIALGLNHEQQHQELILTDIKHAFFQNPLLPAYRAKPAAPRASQDMAWLEHPGGLSLIGHDSPNFAFDNERPRHQVLLRPFRIASRPVSNGDYQAFIADGVIAVPNSGCRTDGHGCRRKGGKRRSIGSRTMTAARASSPWPVSRNSTPAPGRACELL
jgi:formylglycine-generating enzyme required for sulfatase activity